MTNQPEALHHTKYLTVVYRDIKPGDEARELIMHPKMTASSWSHVMNERDRLQDENANLNAGYAAARLEIESLQARIKTMAEEHADELMVALSDAEIDRIVPALESVSEDFPAEWAVWKDRERIRKELRASHGQAPAQAAPATQPAPPQEVQEPVAWYVTGCSRLLDEDEAKAEARHIGGTARAIPLYTAPQADSVTAPAAYSGNIEQELAMLIRRIVSSARRNCEDGSNVLKLANEAWVYLVRKGLNGSPLRAAGIESDPTPAAKAADSVLEDAGGANWQDISTAPKDGTRFVAVGNNYGLYSEGQHTCIAQWFRGCWIEASDWNETSELKYLTHWMPLLPLPRIDAARAAQEGKSHGN